MRMYTFTEAEREKVLHDNFASFEPLELRTFPAKEKRKYIVLTEIIRVFALGTHYSETEVNGILKRIYFDFATIRRYLVDYHFLDRTRDGKDYWIPEINDNA